MTALAAAGFDDGATQMLSTPSTGAVQLSHLPSGEMRAFALTGLPNSTSRGISGTLVWATATPLTRLAAAVAARSSWRMKILPGFDIESLAGV